MKHLIFLFVIFLTEMSFSYNRDFKELTEKAIEECQSISSYANDLILDRLSLLNSSNLPDIERDIEDIIIDYYKGFEEVLDDYIDDAENDDFDLLQDTFEDTDFYSFSDVLDQGKNILEWHENVFRSCMGIDRPPLNINSLTNINSLANELDIDVENLENFIFDEDAQERFVDDLPPLFDLQEELSERIDQFKKQWIQSWHTITISPEDNYSTGVDTFWGTVDGLIIVPFWENYAFIEREGVRYKFLNCAGDDSESECGQIANNWKNTLESGDDLELTFRYIRMVKHHALQDKNDIYEYMYGISSFSVE